MKQIRELRHDRAELVAKARHLVDIVDEQKRAMNEGESKDYDSFMEQIDLLGKDIEQREKLTTLEAELAANSGKSAEIGMSDTELRKYSMVRLLNAMATGDWRGAELEKEASDAVAERLGMTPKGRFIPQDWLEKRENRAVMTKADATYAGYLSGVDFRPENFIEMLRNKMVLQQAGAQYLGGLVGDVAIPKQTGGATGYWVAEGNAPTGSNQTVGQVALSPKTFGAYTDYTRKLLKQSSVDVEMFVRRDLSAIIALGIDKAGLHGTADNNQPRGVATTVGIGSVVGGATGADPDWADIVDLETEVSVDNADVGAMAYITNPKVRGKLKKTLITTTYGDKMIWENGPTPLNGYRVLVSNQVRGDITKSSGSNLSAIFFGNWADLIIGMWGGLDILVDPYTHSTSGTVRVVALQDVDVAVRHAESFAAMLDAST
jgi:HK97 family phage major capsid protein